MDCIDCESNRQCCDWLFVLACSKTVGVEVQEMTKQEFWKLIASNMNCDTCPVNITNGFIVWERESNDD